jgi:phosphate transport system substrate-binding protein
MTPRATTATFREMKEMLSAHASVYAGLSRLPKIEAKGLTVDGLAATVATVADGTFPIVRRMSLYQREPTPRFGRPSDGVLPLADQGAEGDLRGRQRTGEMMRVALLACVGRKSFWDRVGTGPLAYAKRKRGGTSIRVRSRVSPEPDSSVRSAALALGLLAALAIGCRGDPPAKETLLIAGNAAMTRYLDPVIKEFTARNPSVSVVCEPGGTLAAVIALKRGAIDIAAMSRQVEATEDDEYFRDYQVCRDGIAVVVNTANPLTDLTKQQLEDIFDGTCTSWKQLGGADAPIHAFAREKGSRSSRSFNEMVLGGDEASNTATFVAKSEELVAAIKKDPNAIGYLTLRRVTPELKTLKIGGVEMNRLTMLSGRYPLARTFYLGLYLKAPKAAERFVQFALSRDGQEIFAKDGLLPVR